jgi:uracil-DNA glycosylase
MPTKKLSSSPSPKTFGKAFKEEIAQPTAARIAGSDNTITAAELKKAVKADPSLKSWSSSMRSGEKISADDFANQMTNRAVELATVAAGPDGRLSQADADKSELGPAFRMLRGTDAAPAGSLADGIPAGWKSALADEVKKPYFQKLDAYVTNERATANVFPPKELTFAALERTPLKKVKVVVIGQDPYPTAGNANGLSFSVNKGMPIPGSLRNIFKNQAADLGTPMPPHGDLGQWADQGVLLLNTVLTVREGEANSHHGQGWETFTETVVKKINESKEPVVFLLLGAQAQKMASMIDTSKHNIVTAPHPSPLSANAFMKSHPFSEVNAALAKSGRGGIDWQIH